MNAALTIVREFAAPREKVWRMWTEPEYFSIWFGTDEVPIALESVSMDVRVGGTWRATMDLPDEFQIHWAGEYTEVEPPAHLGFTMTDEPGQPAGDPVVVELLAVPGGTQMTLTQSTPDFTDEQYAATIIGYNGFFDSMQALLED
jgi:uncharacterized protein YndB with AHSA1/START domain